MIERRLVGTLPIVAALALLPGCGAIFHGSQTVTIATNPNAKASVYQAGIPTIAETPGKFKTTVFLNTPLGEIVALAPGMKVARIEPKKYVDGLAIVLDVLWSITIIGVAAPITDALLGTFVKTESDIDVQFVPFDETENPMPVYSVEGTAVTASEGVPPPVVAPPPPPPPSASAPPPPPAKPPKPHDKPRVDPGDAQH